MRAIIQRVTKASVTINGELKGEIGLGLMILLGVETEDNLEDAAWLARKICNLRIFDDSNREMNLSVKDVPGQLLIISQFTLHALTKKGNRPSYIKAAKPPVAIPLYEEFIRICDEETGENAATGAFGADMKVALVNDGPVTIFIDSKNKE